MCAGKTWQTDIFKIWQIKAQIEIEVFAVKSETRQTYKVIYAGQVEF